MKSLSKSYRLAWLLGLVVGSLLAGAPARLEAASIKSGYLDSFTGGLSVYGDVLFVFVLAPPYLIPASSLCFARRSRARAGLK
jgi:hypothetical protein